MQALMPIISRATTVGYVPWGLFLPADDEQARKNHDQSLSHLASRGGVSICELVAILEHRRWEKMDPADAWTRVWSIATERGTVSLPTNSNG